MENRFKVIISNKNLYKEIELEPEAEELRVGTGIDCEVRLRKDIFFTAFSLQFVKTDSSWSVQSSNDIYLSVGDARRLMTKDLENGDSFEVCYQDSGNPIFTVGFVIDFDDGTNRYGRLIDLNGVSNVTIGTAPQNSIVLRSPYVRNDAVTLSRDYDSFTVMSSGVTYGVYINGIKAEGRGVLKSGDFLSVSDFFFYYKDNVLYTQNRPEISVNGLRFRDLTLPESYPMFSRNTRIKTVVNEDGIEIMDPPSIPSKPKQNLLTRLLPSLGMLLMALVMLAMGSTTMIIMAGISGGMAVITAVISYREANTEYAENCENRIRKYNAYIAEKQNQIAACRAEEKRALEEIYISQAQERQMMENFSPDLFDRSNLDEDFLCVNLGTGAVPAKRLLKYKQQERLEAEDSLQLIPERMCADYKFIEGAPVICDLKEQDAIGITGSMAFRDTMFKNIIFDIISRQYFTDVRMVMVADEEHAEKVAPYRFLPHVNDSASGVRMIVTDDDSKNIIFEYLYKELTRRTELKRSKIRSQHIVIFLYDDAGFANHPLSKFTKEAQELDVTFVFFGETRALLPPGCGHVIAENGRGALLISAENKADTTAFSYPSMSDQDMKHYVMMLAPVYSEEISLEGSLTKNYTMYEMLHIIAVDDLDLNERWSKSQVYRSMAAPIGISKGGMISLDLHDKAHGPHGLVAGTTGSGKSEVLQTYILSMATLFHPYEAAFVIIDFKGGGMVNQFRDLPHLRGAITNIDGKQIDRSLKSIKAELQTRQRLFAEADVNHIDKYIRKYKAGEVSTPLPHLILIVDEFAELKADQPEFMKELISAARIGRSLGVHLILATQKPSGQVNEQIWSNSRFKICLKVQDQGDSNEVLKSPLAAEIKEPGRAYLQVGNNEIFELFQSAFSGAPEHADDSSEKEFTISKLNTCGRRTPVFIQKRNKSDAVNTTQLDAIVRYVADYCTAKEIRKLPDICLPPLQEYLVCPEAEVTADGRISIGIYDDPDRQYQGEAFFDFDTENTFIVGASQTGKTNLLQLIIRRIASVKKADEASFYIMDFGSMILKNFESLNHVGGVVIPAEEEKLKNLFKLLMEEVENRKEKMVTAGVSSFAAYKEAGYTDLPQIYLMLDNFAVFREVYSEKYESDLLYIAREGTSCGISMIVTASVTSGFSYRYLSNFSNRIAFTCNNSSEYYNIFDRCKLTPENLPGRMLISINKEIFEAQSYISFEGEKEVDRAKAVRQFVAVQNLKNKDRFAKRIPEVPESFDADHVYRYFGADRSKQIAFALNYSTVEPVAFDIMETPLLAIVGKQTANMVNFAKAFLNDLQQNEAVRPAEVYIVDGITRDLGAFADVSIVRSYTTDPAQSGAILSEVEETLSGRYDDVIEEGVEGLESRPLIVVWINNSDAVAFIAENKDVLKRYTNIISRYKKMKVMIVIDGIADEAIGYSSGEVLKKIKENRNAVIFSNPAEHKAFDIPMAFIRQNKKPLDPTQGYYIKEADVVKLRFASAEE